MTRPRIQGFPPIATPDARILILGSMPGAKSLEAEEYYAHKDNAFWRIMGELFGAGWDRPYSDRVRILNDKGIAVWDVLQSCIRPGSLDSAIQDEVPNDFQAFFRSHLRIEKIGLNGGKARDSFKRFVGENCPAEVSPTQLPSTSPAHARMSFAEKREAWRAFLA